MLPGDWIKPPYPILGPLLSIVEKKRIHRTRDKAVRMVEWQQKSKQSDMIKVDQALIAPHAFESVKGFDLHEMRNKGAMILRVFVHVHERLQCLLFEPFTFVPVCLPTRAKETFYSCR